MYHGGHVEYRTILLPPGEETPGANSGHQESITCLNLLCLLLFFSNNE